MSLLALIGTRRLIEILDRLSASGLGPSRASIPGLLRLRLEPRDPGSVDVPRSIAVGGTVDGQVAGSVVVRSETTVPTEKTAAVKVAAVKTPTVKTAAVKNRRCENRRRENLLPRNLRRGPRQFQCRSRG